MCDPRKISLPRSRGQPPTGLLGRREQEQFAALKTEKRRHDWLLGRWTSKLLVQSMIQREVGRSPELDEIVIANDADGAPYVICNSGCKQLQVTLSISHSGDLAFCAATGSPPSPEAPSGLLGADIERVAVLPPGFVQDYFTEMEAALVDRIPIQTRDVLVTAIWSAKEAALKALRLGLTVDTRSVSCLIEPVMDPWRSWVPFQIEWDVCRLEGYALHRQGFPHLSGWWQIRDGYVLTLASMPSLKPLQSASQIETDSSNKPILLHIQEDQGDCSNILPTVGKVPNLA